MIQLSYLFLIFLILNPEAYAQRQVLLPTLETQTIHGGAMSSTTCITANMLGSGSYQYAPGVQSMYHEYVFSFKNISTVTQTITLRALPNSTMVASYSTTEDVPQVTAPVATLTANLDINFALAPLQSVDQTISFEGSDLGAYIESGNPTHSCNGSQHICLVGDSTLMVEIDVAEDRGAVLASVHSIAHRCQGVTDLWQSAQINLPINGGRPF